MLSADIQQLDDTKRINFFNGKLKNNNNVANNVQMQNTSYYQCCQNPTGQKNGYLIHVALLIDLQKLDLVESSQNQLKT